MDLGLQNKVAIITGGSEGIGRATAWRLSKEGAKVAIAARTKADLEATAAEISADTGNEVIGVCVDVRDETAVAEMVHTVVARWGGIDILVNNAGTSAALRFESMSNEALDEDFAIKVKGAIFCTRHALPHLKKSHGAICNTTTPGGKAPTAASQPTALSRAAGISLTKTWSKEFAADGVRANTECVGVLKSRQHRIRWAEKHAEEQSYTLEDHWQTFAEQVPLGRIGEASETGDVIAFLCSARASYVTGAAVNVDGGSSPVV
jgi:3-oxoacyl-[acyl-carrier protein] reductase